MRVGNSWGILGSTAERQQKYIALLTQRLSKAHTSLAARPYFVFVQEWKKTRVLHESASLKVEV